MFESTNFILNETKEEAVNHLKEFSVKSNPGVLCGKRSRSVDAIFFTLTQLSSRLKGVLSSRDSVPSKKLAIFCYLTYCYNIDTYAFM